MYTPDFENIENPEFIEQYIAMMKRAENEAELEEMFKSGELTEEDFEVVEATSTEDESNDLPF
ncbi:MAG: hypothetical protein SLAVMIC_01029 [uncultured marine phage]|uniref:Uncharacterized protein n=1 Tax=uncultured marine phage TaxID=707152 RepID=A0A8D9CF78_9VIRU|nr:MAG: hypothetical protein SLAVMIC_01029 [uncultured marine phage]